MSRQRVSRGTCFAVTLGVSRVVLAIGIVGWLIVALSIWILAPALGHDEAQYAITARDILDGESPQWSYVSPGTAVLAMPGVLVGGGDHALRILPVLLGVVFVITAVVLARSVKLAASGAWLVVVLAGSLGVVKRSASLLSDMPAAAGLLAGAAVLVGELSREAGPRWRIVLAAPAFAAAFYIRYGSAIPIAIIALVAAITGYRALARRPWPVIAAAMLLVLLLAPHLIASLATTGSPLGVLLDNSQLTASRGGGRVAAYFTNPVAFYGLALAPLLVIGIASIIRVRDRWHAALWVMGAANAVAIAALAVPQPRYMLFSLVAFAILGIDVVRRFILARSVRMFLVVCAVLVVSWASALVATVTTLCHHPDREIRLAARVIRNDARGACRIVGWGTELAWYSRCDFAPAMDHETAVRWRHYVVYLAEHEKRIHAGAVVGTPNVVLSKPTVRVVRVDP